MAFLGNCLVYLKIIFWTIGLVPRPKLSQLIKKQFYHSLPYFGHKAIKLKIDLVQLISEFFPHLNPHLILVNHSKVSSFFKFKEALPDALRSSVVYKYSCVHSECTSAYFGSTVRKLSTRVAEHRGVSVRTGQPLTKPPQSAIRSHCDILNHDFTPDQFSIVASDNSPISLRILESLYILNEKPDLNDKNSAFPLKIVLNNL